MFSYITASVFFLQSVTHDDEEWCCCKTAVNCFTVYDAMMEASQSVCLIDRCLGGPLQYWITLPQPRAPPRTQPSTTDSPPCTVRWQQWTLINTPPPRQLCLLIDFLSPMCPPTCVCISVDMCVSVYRCLFQCLLQHTGIGGLSV